MKRRKWNKTKPKPAPLFRWRAWSRVQDWCSWWHSCSLGGAALADVPGALSCSVQQCSSISPCSRALWHSKAHCTCRESRATPLHHSTALTKARAGAALTLQNQGGRGKGKKEEERHREGQCSLQQQDLILIYLLSRDILPSTSHQEQNSWCTQVH